MNFLSASEILEKKERGKCLTLLIRHAERRHITSDDEDYGSKVPLTAEGRLQALAAGRDFSGFAGTRFFASSPVFRCRETAALFAKACGAGEFSAPEKIVRFDCLGEFYVNGFPDYERYLKEGFYPAVCRFVREGSLPGFMPLAQGSEKFLRFLLDNSSADLNVFCSHDAWIVPFLSYFTDVRFGPGLWLNFLSGAAILFSRGGEEPPRIFPLKFLGDGYLRF